MHGTMSEESDAHAKLTEFDFSLIKRETIKKVFSRQRMGFLSIQTNVRKLITQSQLCGV